MFGTLQIGDLQEVLLVNDTSIERVGEDRIYEHYAALLQVYNENVDVIMNSFVERTTERMRGAGGEVAFVTFETANEFSVPQAQKVGGAPENYGFPLNRRQVALQYTRDWFARHTPRELTVQFDAQLTADQRQLYYDLRVALFKPTNVTFNDYLVDRASIPVKALANADSWVYPPTPNGDTIDGSTHTHYLARAGGALAQSDVVALLDTVAEHYPSGNLVLYIAQAQEADVRAMADFTPLVDPRIHLSDTDVYATIGTLDIWNSTDRRIGILDKAEVWVKPWVPSNYMLAWMADGPKPLAMREPSIGDRGLHLIIDDEHYPLRARAMAREYGLGVQNRLTAAILYTGNTSYTAPTFSL
jgi:hypothetical protein